MIVAAIPVKRLAHAKSRLAHVMPVEERKSLMLRLLRRTVQVVQDANVVDRILLVTPEANLGSLLAVDVLIHMGNLNDSLRSAARWSNRQGASGLLIMPADLPFVQAEDVRHVMDARGDGDGVVLAGTADGGTSALLLTPPDIIEPAFGLQSAERHARAARERGVPLNRVVSESLAFDLDTESDLERYLASTVSARSA